MLKKNTNIWIISVVCLFGNPIPPEGFDYNQSQRQAFYIFLSADINNQSLSEGDWIGAFKLHDETIGGNCEFISEECPDINDDGLITDNASICVGSRMWEGPYTPIPVMGADSLIIDGEQLCEQTGTCLYLNQGELPLFKIYESASNAVVPAEPSIMEPFVDLGVYIVSRLTYFTYSMFLEAGHNLISFNALRTDNSLSSMMEPLEYTISTVIGEGLASNFIDGEWVGNITSIDYSDGYWITLNSPALFLTHGYPLDLLPPETIVYELNNYEDEGNLVSWPSSNTVLIGDAIPDYIENAFLGVFGEGMAAQQIDSQWEGTLTHFEGSNGYWVLLYEPATFSFNTNPSGRLSDLQTQISVEQPPAEFYFNQSMSQSFYFVGSIEINNKSVNIGDWIISYCGNTVTGARRWMGSFTDIPAMGNDGTEFTEGYCQTGEIPQFKYFNSGSGEIIALESDYTPEWQNHQMFNIELYGTTTGEVGHPISFNLDSPFPNPFNSTVTIQYTIAEPSRVTIQIVDAKGNLIDIIKLGTYQDAGIYDIVWQTDAVSSGMYFIRMTTSGNTQWLVQKMMLIK